MVLAGFLKYCPLQTIDQVLVVEAISSNAAKRNDYHVIVAVLAASRHPQDMFVDLYSIQYTAFTA